MPFVTDAIWLGKGNFWEDRLRTNGNSEDVIKRGRELDESFSDEYIMELYEKYRTWPKIKWKESIKKIVGLEIPTESGLDV